VTPGGKVELAAEARARVERVMALLEHPTIEALDQSAAELLAATAQIQQIRDEGTSGGAPLKSMIAALRKDLNRVGLLLRHAWEFRAAVSQQASYSQRGELTAQTAPHASWTLDG
jgi:hypothetical protein